MTDREEKVRFDDLVERVYPFYRQAAYDEALRLLEAAAAGDDWAADLAHLRACLHSLAGRPERALAVLQSAEAAGGWWDARMLTLDDDLAAARELDGFDQLVAASAARAAARNAAAGPVPPVIRRPPGPARGVLAVLHGASGSAEAMADTWSAATREGWVLLALGSSYRVTPARRSWPEQPLVVGQVRAALDHLDRDDRALPLVVGGFSAGARAALLWALSGDPVPVSRVIAVSLSLLPDQVPAELPADLPGLVLGGTEDPMIGAVRECAALLAATGIRLEEVEGMAHEMPADFDTRLAAELAC